MGGLAEVAMVQESTKNPSSDPFWLDRSVLVTGATGLVGGWLTKRLIEAGANVTCLVRDWAPHSEFERAQCRQKVNIVWGDVCDQPLLERTLGEYEIESVLHLAAQTIVGIANRNPVGTLETNIRGTWSLLEACRRSPKVGQIVLASSDKAYGEQPELPYNENTPLQGKHPYDVSKSCSDLIAQSYATTFELPVIVTRCGNFFGGGDLNWNRIVPGTIRSLIRGRQPVVRSDGKFVRDYFYVEDGAAAYMLAVRKLAEQPELRGEAFNFSNETPVTVVEIVDCILKAMGSTESPQILNQATHEIREQFLSASKARETLGWEATYTLDAGLKRTIDWYRDYFGA